MSLLIDHFVTEHRKIQSFSPTLKRMTKEMLAGSAQAYDDMKKMLQAWKFLVSDLHHTKEEQILFCELNQEIKINSGGPRCGFFFQYHMEGTHMNEIMDVSRNNSLLPPYKVSEKVSNIISGGSPLSIPLKEHEVGYYAHALLEWEIEQYPQCPEQTNFQYILHHYLGLLDLHIRKEDECLFVRSENIFTSEKKNKILDLCLEFERDIGKEIIAENMDTLLKMQGQYSN